MLDNRVHVWDVRRPFLPIAICYGHQNVATGMSWIESDVGPAQRFLACSKDATLALHDVTKAYKPTEHISASAVALSPFNIAAVSDHVGESGAEPTVVAVDLCQSPANVTFARLRTAAIPTRQTDRRRGNCSEGRTRRCPSLQAWCT